MKNQRMFTIPELSGVDNSINLSMIASRIPDEVLVNLSPRDQKAIKDAGAGKAPADNKAIGGLKFAILRADMVQLEELRRQVIEKLIKEILLDRFQMDYGLARDLLIVTPEPFGKGALTRLKKQRNKLHFTLCGARKFLEESLQEPTAEAEPSTDEADDADSAEDVVEVAATEEVGDELADTDEAADTEPALTS